MGQKIPIGLEVNENKAQMTGAGQMAMFGPGLLPLKMDNILGTV